jgi:hypothetical protein
VAGAGQGGAGSQEALKTEDFFFYFGHFLINIREMNPTNFFSKI